MKFQLWYDENPVQNSDGSWLAQSECICEYDEKQINGKYLNMEIGQIQPVNNNSDIDKGFYVIRTK